uniref:Uncharacterized protein n=1 Tax=Leersia perrieri TaxID=77586 RepID=A0A0D9X583_9ORYZ
MCPGEVGVPNLLVEGSNAVGVPVAQCRPLCDFMKSTSKTRAAWRAGGRRDIPSPISGLWRRQIDSAADWRGKGHGGVGSADRDRRGGDLGCGRSWRQQRIDGESADVDQCCRRIGVIADRHDGESARRMPRLRQIVEEEAADRWQIGTRKEQGRGRKERRLRE